MKIGNAESPFDPTRDIGMVFQQALLLKWRTITDNVLLPAEIVGLPMKAARERARDLLNPWASQASSRNIRENSPAACSNAPRSRAPSSTIQN